MDAPSYIAVMQHARNRALREEVYRAYLTRASSGDLDNTNIISQILKLRLEKAKLLGYKNYAEVLAFVTVSTLKSCIQLSNFSKLVLNPEGKHGSENGNC